VDCFRARFPDASIEIHTGIIFAVGPEVQLFRMKDKLLAFDPDLVVAEFGAANAAWGDRGRCVTDPATEGYVRRLRLLRPKADLLLNLGIFTTMLDDYRARKTPATVAFIRRLADHYHFLITDSGEAIAQRVLASEPWRKFMKDGIHPSEDGYDVHGKVIEAELEHQWALYQSLPPEKRKVTALSCPETTVAHEPWTWPCLTSSGSAEKTHGFVPGKSGRVKFIEGGSGSSGNFTPVRGNIVGILYLAGNSANADPLAEVEVRLDGKGDWIRLPLRNEPKFPEDDDRSNYFQRQFFGGYGLPASGARSLEFRVPETSGPAVTRIAGFFVVESHSQHGNSRTVTKPLIRSFGEL
jgi:hypothetical protein